MQPGKSHLADPKANLPQLFPEDGYEIRQTHIVVTALLPCVDYSSFKEQHSACNNEVELNPRLKKASVWDSISLNLVETKLSGRT